MRPVLLRDGGDHAPDRFDVSDDSRALCCHRMTACWTSEPFILAQRFVSSFNLIRALGTGDGNGVAILVHVALEDDCFRVIETARTLAKLVRRYVGFGCCNRGV